MAVRNAVLSQSPEFKEAKLSAFQDATMVYDLLTVATVRWGQVPLLQEVSRKMVLRIIMHSCRTRMKCFYYLLLF